MNHVYYSSEQTSVNPLPIRRKSSQLSKVPNESVIPAAVNVQDDIAADEAVSEQPAIPSILSGASTSSIFAGASARNTRTLNTDNFVEYTVSA
jgi:hypothetical protein